MRIAINGFGRIGRLALRRLAEFPGAEIVAINDLADPTALAYLFKYDSVHGRLDAPSRLDGGALVWGDRRIPITAEKDPMAAGWGRLGVDVVVADALKADTVEFALRAKPFVAVISTLGTSRGEQTQRPDFIGNRHVIDAAKSAGIRRVLLVTVIGAGDSIDAAPLPSRRFLAEVIELKTRAENHLRASGLDYTIIRPGGLTDGAPSGEAFLADDPATFSFIARADLAKLVADSLGDPATIGKTYSAYDPSRKTMATMFRDR